jgi:hypothetical protein
MTAGGDQLSGADAVQAAALATYEEICRSYHAIDEFRMKLLGLLPLASLVSVFLIDRNSLVAHAGTPASSGSELVGFAAIFAAMLTLALFLYEVRGIQRTHSLITEGKHIEEQLGIRHGQFHVCEQEHARSPLRALNAKFIACLIYALVFAGWFFLALRVGFGIHAGTCVIWTTVTGLAIAALTYLAVRKLTPA